MGTPLTRVLETNAGWSRDIVIEVSNRRFCHFFYSALSVSEAVLADHIIGSLGDETARALLSSTWRVSTAFSFEPERRAELARIGKETEVRVKEQQYRNLTE